MIATLRSLFGYEKWNLAVKLVFSFPLHVALAPKVLWNSFISLQLFKQKVAGINIEDDKLNVSSNGTILI